MTAWTTTPQHRLLLGAVLLFGLALRLPHLAQDLPELYEEATPMRQAWEMWNWDGLGLDPNPHFFNYPALTFYLHFAGQAAFYLGGRMAGHFRTPMDMQAHFASDPTSIVMVARWINLLFGLGTLLGVYRLGRALTGVGPSLMAAAILAVLYGHVQSSRAVVVDIPLTFFAVLSLEQAITYLRAGRNRSLLLSSLFAGLAASCKYTGFFLFVPLLLAQTLRARAEGKGLPASLREGRFWISLVVLFLTFALTSPFCWLDPKQFWNDLSFERRHMAVGHFGETLVDSPMAYAVHLWRNFGITLSPFLLAGVVFRLRRAQWRDSWCPLLGFIVVYLAIVASWARHAETYLLPAFPGLALLAAQGLADVLAWPHLRRVVDRQSVPSSKWAPGMRWGQQIAPISGLLGALLLLPLGLAAGKQITFDQRPDARTLAKKWIRSQVKPGACLAMEHLGPDLEGGAEDDRTYNVLLIPMNPVAPEASAPFYDLRWYTDFDYLVTSSRVSDRYESEPARFSSQVHFYSELASRWTDIAEFGGSQTRGPTLHFYGNPRLAVRPDSACLDSTLRENLVRSVPASRRYFLFRLLEIYQARGWEAKAAQTEWWATQFFPDYVGAWYNLGTFYSDRGRYDEAVPLLEEAIRRQPDRPEYYNNLGVALGKMGRFQAADSAFLRALEIKPDYQSARRNLEVLRGGREGTRGIIPGSP